MRSGGHQRRTFPRYPRPRCATVLPLLLLAGCGSELAEVHGTVLLDGRPLAGGPDVRGMVLYSPRERGFPSGNGALDEAGRYSISVGATEGLRPGLYLVAISATRILPPATPDDMPSGRLITPSRYANPKQSGFEVTVDPGVNTFDFDLQSDQ